MEKYITYSTVVELEDYTQNQLQHLRKLVNEYLMVPFMISRYDPIPRENWSDEIFLKKLKEVEWYLMDDLTASKNAAHNFLRMLLTGNPGTETEVTIIKKFICALEWFDEGFVSASQVVQDFMKHLKNTRHVCSNISPLSKTDLVSEFEKRLSCHLTNEKPFAFTTGNAFHNLGLSTNGLLNLSRDEAVNMVEQYYDLIEVYYNTEKRKQAKSNEIQKSISFVRSLYVFVFIILRCRAKNPDTVMGFIRNGGYLKTARKLVDTPGDVLFSINPEEVKLYNILQNLGQCQLLFGFDSIYYIILGIYCGMTEGISIPHVVNNSGEYPKNLTNPLLVSEIQKFSSLINLLEVACMSQIKYKGIPAIKIIEKLSRLTSKKVSDVLNILCTTITIKKILLIMLIFGRYLGHWTKIEDIYYYHPAETTWRYSKNFSNHVFTELAAKSNEQFLYRLFSILNTQENVQISRIMCLRNYKVMESDKFYIKNMSEKLFGTNVSNIT